MIEEVDGNDAPKEKALAFGLVYHLLQMMPFGIAGLSLAGHSLMRPRPGDHGCSESRSMR